jgi:hypothetical protein
MNVSRQFLRDFAYLANRYGWTPADIEDAKADTRANPALVQYWTTLAAAHRAGYEQTAKNGFIRLQAWCEQEERPDPFIAICCGVPREITEVQR